MRTLRWLLAPSLLVFFLASAACGEDVVDGDAQNASTNCPVGQDYNPITGLCSAAGGNNNGGDNNGGDNNGGNNNGGNNNGGDNNGSDNNGGDNNGDNQNNGEQLCGDGRIEGLSCTPDGAILVAADVVVTGEDCDGNSFELTTTTDNSGHFTFEDIPAGQHSLTISSGSFSTQRWVNIHPGETMDLRGDAGKVCLEGNNVPIAVINGLYDDIGGLLNSMQIDFEVVGSDGYRRTMFGAVPDSEGLQNTKSFLGDLSQMNQYRILFIECGSLYSSFGSGFDEAISNLRTWVEQGNSLYVSDHAHPFVEATFPDAIQFYNETTGMTAARVGTENQTVQADVLSPQMLTLLGADKASLYLNLPGWVVAEDVGTNSQVHFQSDVSTSQGTVSDAPLMISYSPPGTTGNIIFTSFHNNAQGTGMGSDMESVLRFMIFQL